MIGSAGVPEPGMLGDEAWFAGLSSGPQPGRTGSSGWRGGSTGAGKIRMGAMAGPSRAVVS
jgi:hypothetical protein